MKKILKDVIKELKNKVKKDNAVLFENILNNENNENYNLFMITLIELFSINVIETNAQVLNYGNKVNDIKNYIQENPWSRDIVLLYLNNSDFKKMKKGITIEKEKIIKEKIYKDLLE